MKNKTPKKLTFEELEKIFSKKQKASKYKYSDATEWATNEATRQQRTPFQILTSFLDEQYEFLLTIKTGKFSIRKRTTEEIEFYKEADRRHELYVKRIERKLAKQAAKAKDKK